MGHYLLIEYENLSLLTFPLCVLIPIIFYNLNSNCSNLLNRNSSRNKLKKHSVTRNCSDLSLFE